MLFLDQIRRYNNADWYVANNDVHKYMTALSVISLSKGGLFYTFQIPTMDNPELTKFCFVSSKSTLCVTQFVAVWYMMPWYTEWCCNGIPMYFTHYQLNFIPSGDELGCDSLQCKHCRVTGSYNGFIFMIRLWSTATLHTIIQPLMYLAATLHWSLCTINCIYNFHKVKPHITC